MHGSADVRKIWNEFRETKAPVERKHHRSRPGTLIINSSEDGTTLFNVAGMQPLVPYLMGKTHPDGKRLYNIQGCIRTPDIDDIGDERHLTYFEMMWNRSLGDYFKAESIRRSVEFLTTWAGIPIEKLWATVFAWDTKTWIPQDSESIATLKEMGIQHIKEMWFNENMESDNFWTPGPVWPCGPCCEFYYDRGEGYGPADWDLGENDRYTEIWNNVFMAYYADGTGNLIELPAKNVDTGMWFERLLMVLQWTDTIFETDMFSETLKQLQEVARAPYAWFSKKTDQFTEDETKTAKSYRIVVDHLRTASLLINEWLVPSNEWRWYVLRRLIRRARYHLNKLWPDNERMTSQFGFAVLLETLVKMLIAHYEAAIGHEKAITDQLLQEMKAFEITIEKWEQKFLEIAQHAKNNIIPWEEVFKLYDTYGFPVELTKEIAQEMWKQIDHAWFERALEQAKERSRQGSSKMFAKGTDWSSYLSGVSPTTFTGYTSLQEENVKLLKDINVDWHRVLIFDKTPFYGEWGGQTGDRGTILLDDGTSLRVIDVQKYGGVFLHFVQ